MYGKVILTLVLLAFVWVQLGESLKCYTCDNVSSCKSPSTVKCDQGAANKTRDALNQYYNGVKSLNTKDFSCFAASSYTKNTTNMAVRGCIMKGAIECSYSLKNHTYTRSICNICNKDTCNKTNSVGVTSSNILTVISFLVLAKAFVM